MLYVISQSNKIDNTLTLFIYYLNERENLELVFFVW